MMRLNLSGLKSKKRLILLLLVMVALIILFSRTTANLKGVFAKKKPPSSKTAVGMQAPEGKTSFEEEAIPVKLYKVRRMEFKDTLPCIGNIKGFREIDLKFQTAGVTESFNFEEGEKIQEGDIVASLVQRDALLKLKYAEIEMNKSKKLFELGAINSMKFDQAKLEYESAKSDLDKTNIYAMTNGVLGSKILDAGSYVTPNDRIGVFVDMEKVYAVFNVIEKDVPKVAIGQKAEVYADAYPGKTFNGTVDMITPIIEGRSRTETAKVELDNRDGLLKPGMFVRASIATYEKRDAVVIPTSSLKKKENDYFIYVVQKEEPGAGPRPAEGAATDKEKTKKKGLFGLFGGKKAAKNGQAPPEAMPADEAVQYGTVEARKIKVGYMTSEMAEIEDGLREDELIIKEVQEEFKDKSRVEILEVEEAQAS